MCLKQNAINLTHKFPLAIQHVHESFYVDWWSHGCQLSQGSNDLPARTTGSVLSRWFLASQVEEQQSKGTRACLLSPSWFSPVSQPFNSMISQRPLVLNGVHVWTAPRLSLAEFSRSAVLTKHVVVSEIAKIFDVLSLFLLLLSYRLRFFSKKPGNRRLAGMILFLQRSKNRGKRRERNSLCSQKR